MGSASETNAWSDFTYLRYTWKPTKTKDCFQLRMKVIGQVYARFNSFFLDLNSASCFSMAFFDIIPGCFGSSLLAEPLAGGEMK